MRPVPHLVETPFTVLSVDPGITAKNPAGIALLECSPATINVRASRLVPPVGKNWLENVAHVRLCVRDILCLHKADLLVVENPIKGRAYYEHSWAILYEILQIGRELGIQVITVWPSAVKASVAKGNATKPEMIAGVNKLTGHKLTKDAADAVAIGYKGYLEYLNPSPPKKKRRKKKAA